MSFLILLIGSKTPYDSETTFAVRIMINDIPLKSDRARMVQSVKKHLGGDLIGFHVTTEEVAWMATGSRLSLALINIDAENKETHVVTFTPAGVAELKKFAESMMIIRSKF